MELFLLIILRILTYYFYIMIIYVLLTWTPWINSKFGRILHMIVNPYLGIFRGWLVFGNLDFTPMLGLILYQVVLTILANSI